LPRYAYGDLEIDGGCLTFIPEKVKIQGYKNELIIDSLQAIGEIFQHPITDLKTCFVEKPWVQALIEVRKVQKPHWVWIQPEVIGIHKTYQEQIELAEEEDIAVYGDMTTIDVFNDSEEDEAVTDEKKGYIRKQIIHISGVIDTLISMLMAYAMSDNTQRYFTWHKIVRVNEMTSNKRISLAFEDKGIFVGTCRDEEDLAVGFVCCRQYF
jgi:hypothetical protein